MPADFIFPFISPVTFSLPVILLEKDKKITRHMVTIKEPAIMRKERRTRGEPKENKPDKSPEGHFDGPAIISPKASLGGEKVELKDIEQELDEILG